MANNRYSLDKQVEDERNDKIAMMNDVDDERKAFEGRLILNPAIFLQ